MELGQYLDLRISRRAKDIKNHLFVQQKVEKNLKVTTLQADLASNRILSGTKEDDQPNLATEVDRLTSLTASLSNAYRLQNTEVVQA